MISKNKTPISRLVADARESQSIINGYSQEQVDELILAVAWEVIKPENNQELSEMAVQQTGLGNVEDKKRKNKRKTIGLLRDLKNTKTVGIINQDKEKGITNFRKVVNISSTSGMNGNAGQINYATAKAGVVGMAKTMAKEWGRYNVNVNAVGFGLIKTRLTDADAEKAESTIDIQGNTIKVGVNSAIFESAKTMIPLGRPGTPEEAAGAIYMFCIPESNYVTGQILMCHGGGFGL